MRRRRPWALSAFAIQALTDLVHIDLPPVGRQVEAGQPLGEVESVKAVSDLYSPVDGEIVEVNTAMTQNLERLAEDPYGDGWLVKIRVGDPPVGQAVGLRNLSEAMRGGGGRVTKSASRGVYPRGCAAHAHPPG